MKYFSKEFDMQYDDNIYGVIVDGYQTQDDYRDDVLYTEITKVSIVDEVGNQVNSDHCDYEDLIEEIYARDYEVAYEIEGLDGDWSDMYDL